MFVAESLKPTVAAAIEEEKLALHTLSDSIWMKPELLFEERHAHAVLADYLEFQGFSVERSYHLETAFRAEYSATTGGESDVTVCLICEYDALPEIGHACGHNLIAELGIAAAVGVKAALASEKIAGKLVVMGTPAEEGGGGKIRLIKAGAFDDIDFALMAHPTRHDILNGKTLAILILNVRYFGREAHASSAPWEGINALDAAVACYNNLALCRQQMRPTWRVHCIISKGGRASNIIPGETELQVTLRAPDLKELAALKSMAVGCFEAAATSSGCQLKYEVEENTNYETLLLNRPLLEVYGHFAEEEGVCFQKDNDPASTDMGNVSQKVPSIQPYYAIPAKGGNHTKEFAEASLDPKSQAPTLRAARCLALTCLEIFMNPVLKESARDAFREDQI